MKFFRHFFLPVLFCLVALSCGANNLQITGLSVNQATLGTGTVSFNVSWNNAWNFNGGSTDPKNWDAVWICVKFRLCSAATTTQFTQGTINNTQDLTSGGANIPSTLQAMSTLSPSTGSTVITALDDANGLGIMLSPAATGASSTVTGTVTLTIANMPASGTAINTEIVGIEMVYVPNGPYNLGDGSTGAGYSFFHFCTSAASSAPAAIASTNETATSSYFDMATNATEQAYAASVPAAWPKGYYGFYCMKYEISEDLYAQFLNTIGSTGATNRYPGNYGSNRNFLQLQTTTTYLANRPYRAQNYLSWADWEAVLDWAALRPMTELEFEKACRGGTSSTANTAIANEFPWQSLQIAQATALSGTEDGTETFTNASNCNFNNTTFSGGDGGTGPVRGGIFAKSGSNEINSGSTFYGIMDMAGNVREYLVQMTTSAAGDTLTRNLGDGQLNSVQGQNGGNIGDANVQFWPAPNGTPSANGPGASCYGNRGGDWSLGFNYLQTSDRQYNVFSGSFLNVSRTGYSGGRGIR